MVIMLEVANVDEDHNLPFRFATKPKISFYRGQFKSVVRVDLSEICFYGQNAFNALRIPSFVDSSIMKQVKMMFCIGLFLMDSNLSDSYP